jgi:hypothetical protein
VIEHPDTGKSVFVGEIPIKPLRAFEFLKRASGSRRQVLREPGERWIGYVRLDQCGRSIDSVGGYDLPGNGCRVMIGLPFAPSAQAGLPFVPQVVAGS